MSRLDPAIGRRRERVVGGIVVVVGVAVLVLSIIALLAAGSGASSDVSGPKVTLPGGSGTSTPKATGSPTGSSTGSPSGTPSPTGSTSGSPGASSSSSTSTSNSAGTGVGSQPLVVLNNTRETGLAQQAASTFEQGGWTVTSTGNWSTSTISTCAYYDPEVDGAQAAAEALKAQYPAIARTAVKYGALPAGPVVVVLTGGI